MVDTLSNPPFGCLALSLPTLFSCPHGLLWARGDLSQEYTVWDIQVREIEAPAEGAGHLVWRLRIG